jgi:hypothetical protein
LNVLFDRCGACAIKPRRCTERRRVWNRASRSLSACVPCDESVKILNCGPDVFKGIAVYRVVTITFVLEAMFRHGALSSQALSTSAHPLFTMLFLVSIGMVGFLQYALSSRCRGFDIPSLALLCRSCSPVPCIMLSRPWTTVDCHRG